MGKVRYIGLVTAWGADLWIGPALSQATSICDEVIVAVSPWNERLKAFADKTEAIVRQHDVKVLPPRLGRRCGTLNAMIEMSELFNAGNRLWLLDVDEFYSCGCIKRAKASTADEVQFGEKFFLVNMQWYIEGKRGNRLVTIHDKSQRFKPTNKWSAPKSVDVVDGFFHYSMLTDVRIHRERWHVEQRPHQVKWLDECYLGQEFPAPAWFHSCRVQAFKRAHPAPVRHLTGIKDFRKIYTQL